MDENGIIWRMQRKRETPGKAALFNQPCMVADALLLLHQQLHYHFSAVCNRSTRTKYCSDTGFVQEVVVLRGDDTAGGDHDIRTAEFLELLDDLRDEGLMACCKRGDTLYMDIVLLVGSGLQRVEKFRFSSKLPHFLLLNQQL